MKLRTRLFFSFAALMTVALLGLLLGLLSVRQLVSTQQTLQTHHFQVIEYSQQMRVSLGNQLSALFEQPPDLPGLKRAQQHFEDQLSDALAQFQDPYTRKHLEDIERSYLAYVQVIEDPGARPLTLRGENLFSLAFQSLRDRLVELQTSSLRSLREANEANHEQAMLIGGLIGLVALAVLLIGIVTANSLARRFGQPIEALAEASDRVGRGDFNVSLPISPIAELSSLSRRFGLMAESLRQFKSTDVEALAAGQRRLQAVLDSIDDGLLILDRQGRLEHINPVAQRQLGWDEHTLGQSLGHALQQPELDRQLEVVLKGSYLEQPPADLSVGSGGEARLLSYTLTPVMHAQGHIVGAVMVLRDVTEQRAFDRLRSEFVLRASHELRTPVTGMHMAFGLLRERLRYEPGSREDELVDTVEEEMQRLVQLINDLLNFSRYQNGMQTLSLQPCELPELLDETHRRFLTQAADAGVQIEMDVQEPLPRVQIDRAQISRVLDNLLDNALRYSKSGGRVRLQARRHGDRVILSVEDNGEGIPFGQQLRIFEPFVQVGRKKGGAGLGLALCKEVVQLHGGRIGVYSRPGQGTQFYFALPL